jgi:hypothetical protein
LRPVRCQEIDGTRETETRREQLSVTVRRHIRGRAAFLKQLTLFRLVFSGQARSIASLDFPSGGKTHILVPVRCEAPQRLV